MTLENNENIFLFWKYYPNKNPISIPFPYIIGTTYGHIDRILMWFSQQVDEPFCFEKMNTAKWLPNNIENVGP